MALAEAAIANGRLGSARDAAEALVRIDGAPEGDAAKLLQAIDLAASRNSSQFNAVTVPSLAGPLKAFLDLRQQALDGDSQAAIEGYRELLSSYPQFIPAMKQLAIELSRDSAGLVEAEQWARKARETLSDDAELAVVLGAAALGRRDFRYAADILSAASRTLEDDPNLFLLLARSQTELSQVAQARATIEKVRALPLNEEQQRQADVIAASLQRQ
jgi:predicted Zn-dependent protease